MTSLAENPYYPAAYAAAMRRVEEQLEADRLADEEFCRQWDLDHPPQPAPKPRHDLTNFWVVCVVILALPVVLPIYFVTRFVRI